MKLVLLYRLPEGGKEGVEKKVGVGEILSSVLNGEGWTLIRGVRGFVWRGGERGWRGF